MNARGAMYHPHKIFLSRLHTIDFYRMALSIFPDQINPVVIDANKLDPRFKGLSGWMTEHSKDRMVIERISRPLGGTEYSVYLIVGSVTTEHWHRMFCEVIGSEYTTRSQYSVDDTAYVIRSSLRRLRVIMMDDDLRALEAYVLSR